MAGLNISTSRRAIPGKKSDYVPRKLLLNGHRCAAWSLIFYLYATSVLKLRSIRLACAFAGQFTYAVFFYIQNRKMFLSINILCQYFLLFF